ncbi:Putative histidine phosphatase superfamily, clade-1 [Septoria linicola]|uniref:Histidine phosphatase superfamily, clade-1 n=1 Tax=Septoria linicola TaxID=215465 RepID=A0A9Q9AIW2_9PEZI|nr:putative histidine phosphatase superfamily, clade-1 [Septoria linicola]USW46917.1 Putative histidine phosphatase superfamily, clade-1 [Septoria linicola]
MAPTLYLIRHAQAAHNVNAANHFMHDPSLTELGDQQCRALKASFPLHDKIDLVVASPMKRTIQTALKVFGDTLKTKSLQVICLPELQETSVLPCDTGSTIEVLEQEFKGCPVDFQYVTEGWNSKRGRWSADFGPVQTRARQARVWLRDRPEKHIAVVTHGALLHYIIEDFVDVDRFSGTGWANTEWRSVYFTSEPDPASSTTSFDRDSEHALAHVKELSESQQRRKGVAQQHEAEQQAERDRWTREDKTLVTDRGERRATPEVHEASPSPGPSATSPQPVVQVAKA